MTRPVLHTISFLLLLLVATACQREDPVPGYIEANPAYRVAFGSPPAVERGTAYARVAYLPSREDPVKVGAVPLFLFDAADQLSKILQQLAGNNLVLPSASPLYDPFPSGSSVRIDSHVDRSMVLGLELGGSVSLEPDPMLLSLAETALQFNEVDEVIIVIAGESHGPFTHSSQRLVAPNPPDVVMVAAVLDEGSHAPEEIVVNFDRPVKVNSFRFSLPDGSKVAGEYFTSVFQMAIVVHPENPAFYREGLDLVIDWQVTDYLGRVGAGHLATKLQYIVHDAVLHEFEKK